MNFSDLWWKKAKKFLDKNLDIPAVVRSVRMYLKAKTHFWRLIVPERIWLFVRNCQIDGIKYQSLIEQQMYVPSTAKREKTSTVTTFGLSQTFVTKSY